LVPKSSTPAGERHPPGNASSNTQYTAMSNANSQSITQANPVAQVVLPQPAQITKAAKPVRDSAQFV